MIRLGFSFDTNKCTGCSACQIACIIENQQDFSGSWRQVVTFNEARHPELPVFHLSIACNHCADPPCMNYCPALAYSKDDQTGTVNLDELKCIGCRYCSWVCPYDAPDFKSAAGIMTKCTLCRHRIDEGTEPACVTLCPTDALRLEKFDSSSEQALVPGFTKSDTKPSVKIVPLIPGREIPAAAQIPFDASVIQKFRMQLPGRQTEISMRSEWTLLIFTLLVPLLAALYAVSGSDNKNIPVEMIIGCGFLTMIISSWHLGKKSRAYRAVLNWRNSWLSREIIFYTLFLLSMYITEILHTNYLFGHFISVICAIAAIISIDMVYMLIPKDIPAKLHSAQVILTFFLYFAIFTENVMLMIIMLVVKGCLFVQRMIQRKTFWSLKSMIRIFSGFIIPGLLMMTDFNTFGFIFLAPVVLAEILDRLDFYTGLVNITPARQMSLDYFDALSRLSS